MKKNSFVYTHPNISKIYGICGPTRSGKIIACKIISSFKNFEKINLDPLWEQANLLFGLRKINQEAAIYLLRRGFSVLSYNLSLGRELNFRKKDYTSIYNYRNPSLYLKRAKFQKEGDQVFNKKIIKKMNIPIMIHWGIVYSKLLFKSFPNIKLIRMVKNPVEIVFSWLNKNYGGSFYSNPRANTLTIKYLNQLLPFQAYGWEKKYLKLSKVNRVASIIIKYQKLENKIYNSLSEKQKKSICIVNFDNLCQNPLSEVSKLEFFLKAKKTNFTKKILKNEHLPRKKNKNQIFEKKKYLKRVLNKKIFEDLINLENKFLNN